MTTACHGVQRSPGSEIRAGLKAGLVAALAALGLLMPFAGTGPNPGPIQVARPESAAGARPGQSGGPVARAADFGIYVPSPAARMLAGWVATHRDNGGGAFFMVDKLRAELLVFDADARLLASSAVLLGAAPGDDSVPGIGSRPIASIALSERTTPAGRFVGERGRNAGGETIVWVDYDAAVSMHRVRLNNPSERRAQRLASASIDEKRISYGCINVPAGFFDKHIAPVFAQTRALIYVLPERRSVEEVFGLPPSSPAHPSNPGIAPIRPATVSPG